MRQKTAKFLKRVEKYDSSGEHGRWKQIWLSTPWREREGLRKKLEVALALAQRTQTALVFPTPGS